MNMKPYQRQFIEFAILQGALRFGEFTLKSGRISPYFFNAGAFNSGSALAKIGQFYAEAIRDSKISFDILFGPAYKGIPLVAAAAIALSEHYATDKPYCFNRKETKDHGEGGNIVGAALWGRVLVVDDVITAGTAIRESAKMIQQAGAVIAGIVLMLDRQERGQSELSAIQEVEKNYQAKVVSVVNLANIMEFLAEQDGNKAHLESLRAYQQEYGICAMN